MPETGARERPPTKPKVEGGYRRRYREPRRENKNTVATRPARAAFSGMTEDLKGHIYDVGTRYQADQFTATTEALARYAGCKCFNPQDIMIEIEHQKDVKIPIPTTITDINEDVAKLLLGNEIYAYVNKIYQH